MIWLPLCAAAAATTWAVPDDAGQAVDGADGADGADGVSDPALLSAHRQWGAWMPNPGSSTTIDASGILASSTVSDSSSSRAVDVGGAYFRQRMNVGKNNGGIHTAASQHVTRLGKLPVLRCQWRVSTATSGRFYLGFSQTAAPITMCTANDPNTDFIGLQHVTDRGAPETSWMVSHKESTQTLVDTSVSFAVGTVMAAEIRATSSTAVQVKLWNTTGAPAYTSASITTEIPAATTDLGVVICAYDHLNGGVLDLDHYGCWLWTDPPVAEA